MEQWEINRDGIKTYCLLKKQLDKIQADLETEQNKLDALITLEEGVNSPRFDREPASGSINKDLQAERRLDLMEKVEQQRKVVDRKIAIVQYQNALISCYEEQYIAKLPSSLRYQCLRYFGEYPYKETLTRLARKFHYSDASSLLKTMKRQLNKIK